MTCPQRTTFPRPRRGRDDHVERSGGTECGPPVLVLHADVEELAWLALGLAEAPVVGHDEVSDGGEALGRVVQPQRTRATPATASPLTTSPYCSGATSCICPASRHPPRSRRGVRRRRRGRSDDPPTRPRGCCSTTVPRRRWAHRVSWCRTRTTPARRTGLRGRARTPGAPLSGSDVARWRCGGPGAGLGLVAVCCARPAQRWADRSSSTARCSSPGRGCISRPSMVKTPRRAIAAT